MDFWNHVLWSDETKRVQRQVCLAYSQAGGGSVMVWGCMSEALVNSMPKRVKAVLENNGGHKLLTLWV